MFWGILASTCIKVLYPTGMINMGKHRCTYDQMINKCTDLLDFLCMHRSLWIEVLPFFFEPLWRLRNININV